MKSSFSRYILLVSIVLLTFTKSFGFEIGLDFLSFFEKNPDNNLIQYWGSGGQCIKTYTSINALNRSIVESVVSGNLEIIQDDLQNLNPIPVHLIKNNNADSMFLGALYPVTISNYKFYLTARHVLVGKSQLGRVSIDENNFKLNDYQIIEFQKGDVSSDSKIFEDLLVFVPNNFLLAQCRLSSTNNISDFNNCIEKNKKLLADSFSEVNTKTFWIGLQPKNIITENSEKIPFQYSAGNINDKKENYFSLIDNASNHSSPGASGSLIREFKLSCEDDSSKPIGKPIGIVICNRKNESGLVKSIALNINKILKDSSLVVNTIKFDDLLNQEDQIYPFNEFNNNESCVPIDGRGAGGPGG